MNTVEVTLKLISAKQLGQVLNLSKRQIFRLNATGGIPAPVRIGGSVRWSLKEIERWVEAGSPKRKVWETVRKESV